MLITQKTDQILPHNLAGQQQVKMDIFVHTVTRFWSTEKLVKIWGTSYSH